LVIDLILNLPVLLKSKIKNIKMEFIFIYCSNLFPLGIQDSSVLYSTFVPVMIYSNTDVDKLQILLDHKNRAGIYQWTNKESGKRYLGSAFGGVSSSS